MKNGQTRGFAPQIPETDENDENGGCHSCKTAVCPKTLFSPPRVSTLFVDNCRVAPLLRPRLGALNLASSVVHSAFLGLNVWRGKLAGTSVIEKFMGGPNVPPCPARSLSPWLVPKASFLDNVSLQKFGGCASA